MTNVWTADEARTFLATVRAKGSDQDAALFALGLDSGARIGELLGLQWRDLEGSKMRIERQLARGDGKGPKFIAPKHGGVRSLELSEYTLALLQTHKRKQAEVKMANRTAYHDHGLVFAQGWEHVNSRHSKLGDPLHPVVARKRLKTLCVAAKVREIGPHGLRHTCATLIPYDRQSG